MKNFTKLRMALMLALMVMGMGMALAQVSNPLTVDSKTLYKQETNQADLTGTLAASDGEDPDLVTTGTQVPYFVVPDADLNPDWDEADPLNPADIKSTWKWTVPGVVSTTFDALSTTGHYIKIDVNGARDNVLRQITVQEQNGATCAGSTTTLNLKIVAKPSASALAVSDGSAAPDPIASICTSADKDNLNVAFPTFTLTKVTDALIPGNANIQVKASLIFTDHLNNETTIVPAGSILDVNSSGQIDNSDLTSAAAANSITFEDLDKWGTYTLLVTHISDKISRKDASLAAGFFDINGDAVATNGYSATYTVYKSPTTGAIYHLPNN